MTTTVVPGATEEVSEVAGKLLAIAEELGHHARVVGITHDPGLVFLVPDDVAERYSANLAEAAGNAPKRRRRAVDPDADGSEK